MTGKPPLDRKFSRKNPLNLSGLAGLNRPTNTALLPVRPASQTGVLTDTTTQHARKTDLKPL